MHTICTWRCWPLALLQFLRKKTQIVYYKIFSTILRNYLGFITTSAINYVSCNVKVDSLTFINFQENYQTAKYSSAHIMLLLSIKQYLIIVSTSFFQFYSVTLPLNNVSITIMLSMQEGCIMLFTYYYFFVLPERKRSVELCKRE